MPSQNNSSLAGFNKAINGNNENNNAAPVAKGGGSDTTNLSVVGVTRPSEFDGGSNEINHFPTGNTGITRSFAAGVGTGINLPNDLRKLAEVGVSDLMGNLHRGMNDKLGDRQPAFEVSGFRHGVDGRIISATGAYVTPNQLTSPTGNYQILAGSGDQSTIEGTRAFPVMDYNFKQGVLDVNQTLPKRTQ